MINKITIKNNVRIIDNSYVIKKKTKSLTDTYNYLLSRSFNYFPKVLKENDHEIYYQYIEDLKEPKEQKMIDLVSLLTLLHSKTTFYKEIDLEHYKAIYEQVNEEIDNTYNYYNNLMDNIDAEVFMSPANYLIARNITLIYKSLNHAKESINAWYKLIENNRKVRVVLLHNNLTLDHYLKNDKPYLISWDKSTIDMPIFDLVSLYKNNYLDFEFTDLLKLYLSKYPLTKEEMLLFLTIITIPSKIIKQDSEYKTVQEVKKLLDYIYKTSDLWEEYRIKEQTNKS